MKKGASILTLLFCCQLTLMAQLTLSKKDTLLISKLDSLNLNRLDSLITIPQLDTLLGELNSIDSLIQRTNQKIDSLQSLKLPTAKYGRKLDSLHTRLQQKLRFSQTDSINVIVEGKLRSIQKKRDSVDLSISRRIESLQQKINQKLSFKDSLTLDNPLGIKADNPLMDLNAKLPFNTQEGSDLKNPTLPGVELALPNTEISKTGLTGEFNQLNAKVNDVQELPKEKLNELNISRDLDKIKDHVARAGEITSKADQYKEEIKEISTGNLEKVEELPKELERAAMQLNEVKEFSEDQQKFASSKNMLQQYQEMVSNIKDEELKSKAKEIVQKEAPDYFAGHEDKLKAGVAQLDRLKKKYKIIPDSRYLPKHVPNEMKDKPFRDRIVPGISLQFFKADQAAIDFDPYLAYKLSGRFRPGIGFTYRFVTINEVPYLKYDKVFGYRIFNDMRLQGNFYFHTEWEWLHFDPSVLVKYSLPIEKADIEWKQRLNVGLFRTYKISKRFNGQAQILYNALDLKNFPQNRNTTLRFGFEYNFAKKLKKQ